jgi:hypothetical protein
MRTTAENCISTSKLLNEKLKKCCDEFGIYSNEVVAFNFNSVNRMSSLSKNSSFINWCNLQYSRSHIAVFYV